LWWKSPDPEPHDLVKSCGSGHILIMKKFLVFAIVVLLMAFLAIVISTGSTSSNKVPAEKCGECHSDSPAFKEWEVSGHAESLKNLLEDRYAATKCLECHSSSYKRFKSSPWKSGAFRSADVPLMLETASDGIACFSCHAHDSGVEHNLTMPAVLLCTTCHKRFCGG